MYIYIYIYILLLKKLLYWKIYGFLIHKIQNGLNLIVSKRLRSFGVDSDLLNNSFGFFGVKLKIIQPHLRMLFVKTLTDGWHTSSRMHEATWLPCIFGSNSLPINAIALSASVVPAISTKDETLRTI